MTREEAAKDPKRNPKKRRANYTQSQERQPGKTLHYNHAQNPPELIQGNQAQKRQSNRTHNGKTKSGTAAKHPKAHRTAKAPQAKKNPRNKIKANSGPYTKPGKATTAGNHGSGKGSTQEPRKASERNAERLPEGAKGPQMKPGTTEAAPGLPKRTRKTTTATDDAPQAPQSDETSESR